MATSRAVDDPDSTRGDVVDSACQQDDVVGGGRDLHWYDGDQFDDDPDPMSRHAATERFDAFDSSTWNLETPPVPWYRTRQAVGAAVVAGMATVTLVVSVVLLAFRGSSEQDQLPRVDSSHTADSNTPTAPPTVAVIPPPAVPVAGPPPPPPEPTYAPAEPRPNYRRQQPQTPATHVNREPPNTGPAIPPVRATPAPGAGR